MKTRTCDLIGRLPHFSRPRAILTYFSSRSIPRNLRPHRLRGQKCLTGPAEWVQNQIAGLAERLDQLLGKGEWKHRRVFDAPLVATNICDDHVRDPGNAVACIPLR